MADFKVRNYTPSFYIGDTTQGISSAVFFDPNFASFNNISPVCLITGAPGGGKTFFALTLAAQSAIAGKMTVVIDPKADFISLSNLKKDIDKIHLISLSENSRRGIIDPFVICGEDKTKGVVLAKELIKIFTNIKDLPFEAIDPILSDISKREKPSFTMAVERFIGFNRKEDPQLSTRVRNIGAMLKTISGMPFAKLAFSNPYNVPDRVPMKEGMTIITMLGLELPGAQKPKDEYSELDNLASGLMFLVTDYVHKVMQTASKGIPKLLIIDEAWAVLGNQAGVNIVRSVSLLGRSLGMSMVLATQNAEHIANVGIGNTITTFFAFRTNGKEGNKITELMGLRDPEEEDPRDFSQMMENFEPGECLMKDFRKRYATVKISAYKKDWAEAFETNPEDKAKRERKRESEAKLRK